MRVLDDNQGLQLFKTSTMWSIKLMEKGYLREVDMSDYK